MISVTELKQTLNKNEKNIRKLQNKLSFVQSQQARAIKLNKEVTLRQKEIDRLSKELAHSKNANKSLNRRIKTLKQIGKTERRSSVKVVTVVNSFNKEAIETADLQFGLHDKVVLLEDASGGGMTAADLLAGKGVRAIIVKNEMSDAAQRRFFETDIPVLPMTKLPFELFDGVMTVDKDTLDLAIKQSKQQMSEAKQFESFKRLESLIERYKHKRATNSHRNS